LTRPFNAETENAPYLQIGRPVILKHDTLIEPEAWSIIDIQGQGNEVTLSTCQCHACSPNIANGRAQRSVEVHDTSRSPG